MFAPKVAKAAANAAANPTNSVQHQRLILVAGRSGRASVEPPQMLQRTVGDQATLSFLAQRAQSLPGDERNEQHEQKAEGLARKPPVASCDFSKIPVFPPDRPNGRQPAFLGTAPPLPNVIQPRLIVGAVDDPLEHEADRVADQVMRMPDSQVSAADVPPHIGRCASCEKEEAKALRTKVTGIPAKAAAGARGIVHEVLGSPGRPLDAAVRTKMEAGLGHDFSQVRVHADDKAAASARAIDALAYTVGRDIVFGAGQYAPATAAGMKLLAHEIVHVVQQGMSGFARSGGGVALSSERIQRQPAPQRATPRQQPLDADAERIVAAARDANRDLKSRGVKLVYDILNKYFQGYSSKIAGVGYDDRKAANQRLATEIKQTNDPRKPYGLIWVGHIVVEEAIRDPGGFAGVVASIAHELEHVDQWRDPAIGSSPGAKDEREFLAHAHEALFVEPSGTSKVHHAARASHIDAALGAYNCLNAGLQQKPDYLQLYQTLLTRRAHEIKYADDPKKPAPINCVHAP